MSNARYDSALGMERLYPTPGPGLCAWCWRPLPKGRRRWCSGKCLDPALHIYLILKGHTDTVRAAVRARDRGVCARCGVDTEKRQRAVIETQALWRWLALRQVEDEVRSGFLRMAGDRGVQADIANRRVDDELVRAFGTANVHGHQWEAHHKVAVAEGGGGCGLDGYETLCLPCHKVENRALAARLASRRFRKKLEK